MYNKIDKKKLTILRIKNSYHRLLIQNKKRIKI